MISRLVLVLDHQETDIDDLTDVLFEMGINCQMLVQGIDHPVGKVSYYVEHVTDSVLMADLSDDHEVMERVRVVRPL